MTKKTDSRPTAATSDGPKQSIQVLSRAANVLRALEGEPEGLSLGQISQRVGLARSTVQRIVDALRSEQFVIAASPTAGVRLRPPDVSAERTDVGPRNLFPNEKDSLPR